MTDRDAEIAKGLYGSTTPAPRDAPEPPKRISLMGERVVKQQQAAEARLLDEDFDDDDTLSLREPQDVDGASWYDDRTPKMKKSDLSTDGWEPYGNLHEDD